MKRITMLCIGMAFFMAASAQMSASVSANYTMYKGDFQKKTPGIKAELGYIFGEKTEAALGFTYHLPINVPSYVVATNGSDFKDVPTDLQFNFKTINLTGRYYIKYVDEEEDGFNAYGNVGIGFILVNYKEKMKGNVPTGYSVYDEMVKGSENGFMFGAGIGMQYTMGAITPFVDANISLPANNVNGSYYENPIPTHFSFNLGAKLTFGGN